LVLDAIKSLADIDDVLLYVLSGRDRAHLEKWFGVNFFFFTIFLFYFILLSILSFLFFSKIF